METIVLLVGLALNLVVSGGVLYKMVDFAKDYGALKEKVTTHGTEIERLRTFSHDVVDGKIPLWRRERGE